MGEAPQRGHIRTLDGLRGVAVLLVLVTHVPAPILSHVHRFAHHAAHLGGYLGVDIFFVLSGYLITRILLVDAAERAPLSTFYGRRFFRIFPIYYLVLALHAAFELTPAVVWSAVYLSNYYFALTHAPSLLAHTWSLAVEEHFYLLWPALIRLVPRRHHLFACYALMVASLVASAAVLGWGHGNAESLVYSGSQSRMLSLCFGSVFALRHPGTPSKIAPAVRLLAAGAGCLGVITGLGLAYARSPWAFVVNLLGFASVSLALLMTALNASRAPGVISAFLTSRFLVATGRISYGLYLYHPFVYAFCLGHPTLGIRGHLVGLPSALQVPLAMAGAYAVAACSFSLVERPLLRLQPGRHRKPAPSG